MLITTTAPRASMGVQGDSSLTLKDLPGSNAPWKGISQHAWPPRTAESPHPSHCSLQSIQSRLLGTQAWAYCRALWLRKTARKKCVCAMVPCHGAPHSSQKDESTELAFSSTGAGLCQPNLWLLIKQPAPLALKPTVNTDEPFGYVVFAFHFL